MRLVLFLVLTASLCLTLKGPAAGHRRKVEHFPRLAVSKMDAGRSLAGVHRQGKGKEDMNMVSLEVAAFRTLRTLRATPAQTKKLLELFKEDFVKDSKREPAKTTLKFRKALVGVRDMFSTAGAEGDEDEEVRAAIDRLDLLRDEDEDLDDGVDVTPAVYGPAREALRQFSPRQIYNLVRATEDEITDPASVLLEALEDGLNAKPDDWKTIREDASNQVAWLMSGLNPKNMAKFRTEAVKWLDEKYKAKMKPADFSKKREALRTEAEEKFRVLPTTVLANIAWHRMAELLCNPRLPAALKARLKAK
jgi:hypothetical protein